VLRVFNSNLKESAEFVSAAGPWLRTSTGATYFDLWLGSGTLLFGHHASRNDFVPELLPDGGGIPNRLVQLLSKAVEFEIGGIGFQTSGSGAVTRAVRLARAATGRSLVAVIGDFWHGSDDQFLFLAERRKISEGIPESSQLDVAWFPSIEAFLSTPALDTFAGVLLEPIQGANPSVPCLQTAEMGWRVTLRRNGVLLILDEVITGFRERFGSCSISRVCCPDIVIFGKAAAGGFPVGMVLVDQNVAKAVEGRKLFWGGTFAASPTQLAHLERNLSALDILDYREIASNLRDVNEYVEKAIGRSKERPILIKGELFSRLSFATGTERRGGREFLPVESILTVTEWARSFGLYVSSNGLIFSSVYNICSELAIKETRGE
jgi:glutamate-1-semialdehyde 2,1-aminomutase